MKNAAFVQLDLAEVQRLGMSDLFETTLANSASEFKEKYEALYPNEMIWDSHLQLASVSLPQQCIVELFKPQVPEDLSQNPGEEVNRGRKSSSDGSLPTFCRSSHSLQAPQKVVCPLVFCACFS